TLIYTLSLHDALPISPRSPEISKRLGRNRAKPTSSPCFSTKTPYSGFNNGRKARIIVAISISDTGTKPQFAAQEPLKSWRAASRSEEHTSELQSLAYL